MVKVIVLGGGFAGVFAAKQILKKTKRFEVHVTLIDKNSYHLFTPSLYEVATAEEPRSNICIPFKEILPGISMIKDEVLRIKTDGKRVQLKNQTVEYDYLVIALGSESAYYGIPGLAQYSIPFKNLDDACRIRNTVRTRYEEKKKLGQALTIAVVGGGPTGVELSTELSKFKKRLGGNVEISLFQGGDVLLKRVSSKVSEIARKRLERAGVNVNLNSRLKKVSADSLQFANGRTYPFDVLIWTGGVRPNPIIQNSGFPLNSQGRIDTDEFLRVKGHENIFAVGDIAGETPEVAQVAHEEGTDAGENIVRTIKGEKLITHKYKLLGYLIPLYGRYVLVNVQGIIFGGILGFVFQQLVFFRYLLMILPPWKAFKRWNRFEEYLMK